MKLVMLDVDPTTVELRTRDTEHEGSGSHTPGPWSSWGPIQDDVSTYTLALLAASELIDGSCSTAVLALNANAPNPTPGADPIPIRTIEYEIRTKR